MADTTLYNKYRPRRFSDVVGQQVPVRTLSNALERGNIDGAYLLTGPRGTGKTSTARIFAKAAMCTDRADGSSDACDECQSCQDFDAGASLDYQEIDGASNKGIDNVRRVISWASLPPQIAKRRVVVVDEVHLLSNDAVSALLKTIEEPPTGVVFLLCTTNPAKVPATIRSRCIRLMFSPISDADVAGRLRDICVSEGYGYDDAALSELARRAQGGLRDAISSLSAVASYSGSSVTSKDVEKVLGAGENGRVSRLLADFADRNLTRCMTFVESGDTSDMVKDAVLRLDDAIGDALMLACVSADDRDIKANTLVDADKAYAARVRAIASSWTLAELTHVRAVIARLAWKVSEPMFMPRHVFAEMMLMSFDPSCDPSCEAFEVRPGGRRISVPEVREDMKEAHDSQTAMVGPVQDMGDAAAQDYETNAKGAAIVEQLRILSEKVDETHGDVKKGNEATSVVIKVCRGIVTLLRGNAGKE